MKIKFSGDEGIFEPLIFCPGDNGAERVTGETGGKKWELPSALEQLQFTIAHVMTNLAPEMMEKFSKAATGLSLPEDFEKLVEIMNKALAKSLNKHTRLKLIGNSKGYVQVDGHRADITMLKTARALAALEGRTEAGMEELRRAAELALPHRLRRAPFEQAGDAGIDWEALFYG